MWMETVEPGSLLLLALVLMLLLGTKRLRVVGAGLRQLLREFKRRYLF